MTHPKKPKKVKICPRCGVEHSKRGPYCGRSCGNVRQWTDQQRKNKSIANKKYFFETDEGELKRWEMSVMRKSMHEPGSIEHNNPDYVKALESEDYVIPPNLDEEELNYYIEDNSIWTKIT